MAKTILVFRILILSRVCKNASVAKKCASHDWSPIHTKTKLSNKDVFVFISYFEIVGFHQISLNQDIIKYWIRKNSNLHSVYY